MRTTANDIARPECEHPPFTTADRRAEMGRTSEIATCPFCGAMLRVFVWSLQASGKRCGCGALLHVGRPSTGGRAIAHRLPGS